MKLFFAPILIAACALFTNQSFAENSTGKLPNSAPVTSTATFTAGQTAAIENIVHQYLLTHPEVLIEVSRALEQKQQMLAQQKADKVIPQLANSLTHDPQSPSVGDAKNPITVVEFFDYQCPHCKVMAKTMEQILASNPNVRVVYKEFPIFGADSDFAAKAALAAQRQGKFLVLHNALLNTSGRLTNQAVLDIAKSVGLDVNSLQANMNAPEYAKELQETAALANKIGINATPGFVVLDTHKDGKVKSIFVMGQMNKDQLDQTIQAVQKK